MILCMLFDSLHILRGRSNIVPQLLPIWRAIFAFQENIVVATMYMGAQSLHNIHHLWNLEALYVNPSIGNPILLAISFTSIQSLSATCSYNVFVCTIIAQMYIFIKFKVFQKRMRNANRLDFLFIFQREAYTFYTNTFFAWMYRNRWSFGKHISLWIISSR